MPLAMFGLLKELDKGLAGMNDDLEENLFDTDTDKYNLSIPRLSRHG